MKVHENKLKKNVYKANDTISKNARFLRLVNGPTQQKMADLLGICRSAYHSFEKGGKHLDFEQICILADFYEIDVCYLVSIDICDQIMNLIQVDQKRVKASVFLERYFALSRSGKEQIRDEIFGLAEHEKRFKKFPWKYEGFEDLVSTNTLYEKQHLYEERARRENGL